MGCCDTYSMAKFIMTSALGVFFANGVEIVNQENIPEDGPVILVGPHFNQFVDSMTMLKAAGKRQVSFIIAEKSMHRRVIGDIAKALKCVPVVRAQDKAKVGAGSIQTIDIDGLKIIGNATNFKQECAQKGCMVALKSVGEFAVDQIISDTELTIKPLPEGKTANMENFQPGAKYKVVPKIPQKELFNSVFDLLARNGTIGIFPEGGSHDRTDLLPLKAGVTVMALGAAVERGVNVKICAVGMNYFSAHVFRSNAFVDISEPISLRPELIEMYKNGQKREACAELLEEIRVALNSVTIHAPSYDILKAVRTARRMYANGFKLDSKQFLKLNHRFVQANELWQEDPVYMHLLSDIHVYLKYCWAQGLTDKEVANLPPLGTTSTLCYAWKELFLTLFIMLIVFPLCLPGIILNLPIPLRIRCIVKREMEKALAGSTVKIAARDVAASQKVMAGALLVVVLMLFYTVTGLILMFFLWPHKEIEDGLWYEFIGENAWWLVPLVFLFVFPIYTFYIVIRVGESVNRRARHLPALFKLIFSVCKSTSKNPAEALRRDRRRLVVRVQDYVENNIQQVPGWAEDRIILPSDIQKRRSETTLKLMESGDLSPQLSISISREASSGASSVAAPKV